MKSFAALSLLLAAGYLALESDSIFRGLAPRPGILVYGYEPFSRQPPPASLLPAAPILFDETTQFLPWQEFARREFAAGRFPLWNPYQFCGAPHLGALQPAILSPLTLLALPRSALAQHAARFLGFLIAGLGAYFWLSAAGLAPPACHFGAVIFAFCGFLTLWAGHPHFLSAVWLPLLLHGVERLRAGRGAGFFGTSAAMAASLLGGHGETSFHLALVASIYALCRAPRTLPRLLGAIAFGAALAAAALLPFLDYLLHSSALAARQTGFEMPRALPWQALASLFVPEFWGGEPFGPFRLDRLNLNEVAGGFVGPAAVALALCARSSPLLRPALAILLSSLLLGFEPWPVSLVAAKLPLLSLAYNGRLLLAVALVTAALGAVGLEAVIQRRASALPAFAAVAALVVLLGLLGRVPLLPYLGSLLVAGFLLYALRSGAGNWAVLALIAVAALPSLRLARGYHGGAPGSGAWPALGPGAAGIGSSDRFAAFGLQALPPQLATAYGLRDLRGYDAMTPRRYEELLARVEPLVGREGRLGIFRLRSLSNWAGPLYEFLGVRFLYFGRGAGPPEAATLASPLQPLGGGFWALPPGPGRARFTSAALFLPDEEAVLRYVASEEFDPDVPAFVGPALVGAPLAAPSPASPAVEAPLAAPRRVPVRFLIDDPAEVALKVDAPAPGYVVLADLDFPGWLVFLDGVPATPLRANHAFRAVRVPAGRHLLRWIYHPDSFALGVFVSSLSLWIVVSWSALRWGLKSRRQPLGEGQHAEQGHAHRQSREGP